MAGVDVVDDRTVRYRFKLPNRELPSPWAACRCSAATGGRKRQGQAVRSGGHRHPDWQRPYKIGPVQFGKDITYVRDPQYWARDLNVRKGTANFDRILVKIYKDSTARLEALKAGEFDLMRFFSAGDWARRVNGKKFDTGELVKGEFKHKLPAGFKAMCSTPAALPAGRACARRWAWRWTMNG